jgi:hypothetical protein
MRRMCGIAPGSSRARKESGRARSMCRAGCCWQAAGTFPLPENSAVPRAVRDHSCRYRGARPRPRKAVERVYEGRDPFPEAVSCTPAGTWRSSPARRFACDASLLLPPTSCPVCPGYARMPQSGGQAGPPLPSPALRRITAGQLSGETSARRCSGPTCGPRRAMPNPQPRIRGEPGRPGNASSQHGAGLTPWYGADKRSNSARAVQPDLAVLAASSRP